VLQVKNQATTNRIHFMTNHIVSQRFIKCHNKLREAKTIKSSRQFALELDYLPQSLSEILNGRRDVTIEVIRKAVDIYRFNPTYLFTGEGDLFLIAEKPPLSIAAENGTTEPHLSLTDTQQILAELAELKRMVAAQTTLV
jgi:transcriptional regulator with XRE-family HTH domain